MPQKRNKITHYIKPMLATAIDKPFDDSEWLFELKLDGYRAIAELSPGRVLLYSRNGLNLAARYPSITAALKKNKKTMVVDGEIVAFNEKGKPDFQLLQNYPGDNTPPLAYYVFDILSFKKKDLTDLELLERKKILKRELIKSPLIIYCDHIEERGKDFFRVVKKDNMEGIMAKKKDSLYYPGTRTKQWLKIKYHKSREAIIAGFTEPKGGRKQFGSLLLAEYKRNKLHYIGHAGTGFDEKTLDSMMKKMKPLIRRVSPFETRVKANGPVTWLKPMLVAEIGYSEITRDGILRHPVFKGLRDDKESKKVKEETEKEQPAKPAKR